MRDTLRWSADRAQGDDSDFIILNDRDEYVCEIARYEECQALEEAHVTLIEAVPDLYRMLKRMTDWMGKCRCDGEKIADVSHDEEYDRTCSTEEPGGCLLCEARALLLRAVPPESAVEME